MATHSPTSDPAIHERSHFRSDFGVLVTSLSTRFINLPVESIDDGILEALRKVGTYTGVDRCFVYHFADDKRRTARLTHEWCAPGIDSVQHMVHDVDVGVFNWAVEQLRAGEVIHVPDVEKLPPHAAASQEIYRSLRVRSAMYVPMLIKSEPIGVLGFSCIDRKKSWSEDSIALLRVVGEIVVNAIDRQRTDIELRETQERYKSVVDTQTEFIVRWKPDGEQTFVNHAVSRFFSKHPDQLVSDNVFSIIHPDDVDAVRERLARLTPDSPTSTGVHRVCLSDGGVAWLEWTDSALFDASGNLTEYQSVGRDITERKMARDELEHRQKFQNLLLQLIKRFVNLPPNKFDEQIVDALQQVAEFVHGDRSYIYLADEQLTEVNLTYQWLAPGAPPTPPELRKLALQKHGWALEVLKRGDPYYLPSLDEIPQEHKDFRQQVEQLDVGSFLLVPAILNGKLLGLLGVSRADGGGTWSGETTALLQLIGEVFVNALDRKAAEQAVQESEERLSLTIDAVADGFYDWNIPTGEIYVSDNWLSCWQVPQGENRRHLDRWRDAIHPEDRHEVDARLQAHLDGRTEVFECEYRVRYHDEWKWNLDRGRVISRDASGKALRMVGIDRDITDQVRNRDRLIATETQLAHMARVATMGEIVAGIAHEVNQPLHAAATFANAVTGALASDEPDSQARAASMVQKISGQITRAADIIKRLREFTRPGSVHMSQFDLNALVREAAELLAYEGKRREIRLEFGLDEFLPMVTGDRVQIQQVLVNLLRNAYEAANLEQQEKPIVRIVTARKGNQAQLEVSDNGVGLPEGKDVEEMFNAFVTTKSKGMGMGLALCRSIVTKHHGRIWGEPNEQSGMTFIMQLPLKQDTRDDQR